MIRNSHDENGVKLKLQMLQCVTFVVVMGDIGLTDRMLKLNVRHSKGHVFSTVWIGGVRIRYVNVRKYWANDRPDERSKNVVFPGLGHWFTIALFSVRIH